MAGFPNLVNRIKSGFEAFCTSTGLLQESNDPRN